MLSRPSRSYADVQHDPNGISGVGNGPYQATGRQETFKTYRPPLAETHLKRSLVHDQHPTSPFAPLPHFAIPHKLRKEQIAAGQRAEVDHLLSPAYRSSGASIMEDDAKSNFSGGLSSSSKKSGLRTAGGLGGLTKRKESTLKHSNSVSSSTQPLHSAGSGAGSGSGLGSGKVVGASTGAGIYIDSNGKVHDTEFDPFAGVSRRKSKRSAFGSDRRRGSDSSSSSTSSKSNDEARVRLSRVSLDTGGAGAGSGAGGDESEEIRKRLDMERRRLDEVSGYAAARRRSMISERSQLSGVAGSVKDGRTTPSTRSSEDGLSSTQSLNHLADRYGNGIRSRSQQGNYIPSPLSPSFNSEASSKIPSPSLPPTAEHQDNHSDTTADVERKETQMVSPKPPTKASQQPRIQLQPPPPPKVKVEIAPGGTKKITGFDAPTTPVIQHQQQEWTTSSNGNPAQSHLHLHPSSRLPNMDGNSGRSPSPLPSPGRRSFDSTRPTLSQSTTPHRMKPPERPRDQSFPETPAQIKKREERERKSGVGGGLRPSIAALQQNVIVDPTVKAVSRVLPEIEIVEDDDPRIVFPANGHTTRVQTVHDHVIRGPFSLALHSQAQAQAQASGSHGHGYHSPRNGGTESPTGRRASSTRSYDIGFGGTSTNKAPSTIIDEGQGGYLPSRWASGDRQLRLTEGEKELYRPREWGGKKGELGGRPEEWRPDIKESMKKQLKELAVATRFSLFRTKKKLSRKVEL